jgi:hypothetical protein
MYQPLEPGVVERRAGRWCSDGQHRQSGERLVSLPNVEEDLSGCDHNESSREFSHGTDSAVPSP